MENKFKRNAILVLGMHRSGTSAATRVLSLMGYELPKSLMGTNESNEVGHWESDSIVVLSDALLKELGASWDSWQYITIDEFSIERKKDILDDISRHLRLEFPGKKDFILKDPRISRLAGLYLEAFEDSEVNAHVVMSIRNPLSVADSLLKRDNMPKGDASLLWLRYVLDAEYSSRGQNRAFFSYEGLLAESSKTLKQISKSLSIKFPLTIEAVAPQINEFLDEDMQHHVRTAEEVVFDPIMRGWVDRAYSLLMGLCAKPNDAKTLDELDVIRDELDHVGPVMENLRREADSREAAKAELVVQAETVNKALGDKIADFVTRNTQLKQESKKFEAGSKSLNAEIIGTKVTIDNMAIQLRDQRVELTAITTKYTELASQTETLEGEDTRKGHKLEIIKKVKEDLSLRIEEQIKSATVRYNALQKRKKEIEAKLEQQSGEATQLSKTLEQKGKELSAQLKTEKDLRRQLNEKEKSESDLKGQLDEKMQVESDLKQAKSDLKGKLEEARKSEAGLKKQMTQSYATIESLEVAVKGLQSENDVKSLDLEKLEHEGVALLAKNFDLATDIQILKTELKKEKRTFFRPAIRRIRGFTGRILRFVLPTSFVDNIAGKIPLNETPLNLISQPPTSIARTVTPVEDIKDAELLQIIENELPKDVS